MVNLHRLRAGIRRPEKRGRFAVIQQGQTNEKARPVDFSKGGLPFAIQAG
ncbi:hypothetical protein [Thioalkalivibrio sp. ALE16]|nr:hypothetical protein [Thioalkalivibrio sp. ALE16]